MVTRVRIEAEGSTPDEVTRALQVAHEALISDAPASVLNVMFGEPNDKGARPGLYDAQAGEFVIERFAKDLDGEAGHGAIFYRGRMTAHFAPPHKAIKLGRRSEAEPYVAT